MDNRNGNSNGTQAGRTGLATTTFEPYLVPGYFVKFFQRQMYWLRGLQTADAAEEEAKVLSIFAQMDHAFDARTGAVGHQHAEEAAEAENTPTPYELARNKLEQSTVLSFLQAQTVLLRREAARPPATLKGRLLAELKTALPELRKRLAEIFTRQRVPGDDPRDVAPVADAIDFAENDDAELSDAAGEGIGAHFTSKKGRKRNASEVDELEAQAQTKLGRDDLDE